MNAVAVVGWVVCVVGLVVFGRLWWESLRDPRRDGEPVTRELIILVGSMVSMYGAVMLPLWWASVLSG